MTLAQICVSLHRRERRHERIFVILDVTIAFGFWMLSTVMNTMSILYVTYIAFFVWK